MNNKLLREVLRQLSQVETENLKTNEFLYDCFFQRDGPQKAIQYPSSFPSHPSANRNTFRIKIRDTGERQNSFSSPWLAEVMRKATFCERPVPKLRRRPGSFARVKQTAYIINNVGGGAARGKPTFGGAQCNPVRNWDLRGRPRKF